VSAAQMAMTLIGVVAVAAALYLLILATVAVQLDRRLRLGPRIGQLTVAWLLPFVGPCLVLLMINEHSPEVAARLWLPWPFSGMVRNRARPRNTNRDDLGSADDMSGSHSFGDADGD
jgi:hypothetical protein